MASNHVKEFTAANWQQEVVQSDQPVVVDFWAPWCGPCRVLGPVIDKLADRFAGRVKVGKVNVDDSPDLAGEYGVNSIPRVFIFKGNKKPLQQFAGVTSEKDLVNAIDKVLGGDG
jgi:thioredoxin 1